MTVLPSPAVQRVENGVLLQGQALADVAALVAVGIKSAHRQDGITASPRLKWLAEMLADAARAASAPGRPDIDTDADPAPLADEITTTEAAVVLELSPRQVRRLAPQLGGRRTRAGWLIRRGQVAARIHERSTAA